MSRNGLFTVCWAVACMSVWLAGTPSTQPAGERREERLRIAIAGLVHGHVSGFLAAMRDRNDVELVGVFEPDAAVRGRVGQREKLQTSILYDELGSMLERTRPEVVAAFTSTADHPMVVEACARRHVHVMMEKPLAISMEHARAIRQAARSSNIHVVVNYETTWYRSHGAIWKLVKERRLAGEIRRMVAMDGHPGPRRLGSGPSSWPGSPTRRRTGQAPCSTSVVTAPIS